VNTGDVLENRYRIMGMLGQGGMSKVYLAEDIRLGTLRAIKEIRKINGYFPDGIAAGPVSEPEILKKLQHPALPAIIDMFGNDDGFYIVVEYINGISLDKKLNEVKKFPEPLVMEWALQLCDVLSYLHSQKPHPIIYRDMKPSNIMLTESGFLKLIDFGIAREFKEKALFDTVCIGTRGYAAPEQYGCGQTNVTTDIYSLGMTLYHLLTGISPAEPPYGIKPLRQLDESFSEETERIIQKCTRQNPGERYQSVEELKADISILVGELSEKALAGAAGDSVNKGKQTGRHRVFKKMVLTIWDNAEFGCELAYIAAKMSDFTVLLIDMDLLAPKADIFLNVKKYPGPVAGDGQKSKTGLNIVIDALDRNYFTPGLLMEASIKRKELKNLFVLTGSYNLEDYEYFRDVSAVQLIENAYLNFDLTILLVNRSIYDSYTLCALIKSDYNLIPLRADIDKLREFNRYIDFLSEKQNIRPDKYKFIAYEYEKATDVDISTFEEATGGNCLGFISYATKRRINRNLKGIYARNMSEYNLMEYKNILAFLNIIPRRTFSEKLKDMIRAVWKHGGKNAGCEITS